MLLNIFLILSQAVIALKNNENDIVNAIMVCIPAAACLIVFPTTHGMWDEMFQK